MAKRLGLSIATELAIEVDLKHVDQIQPGMIVCSCGWAIEGAKIGAQAAAMAFMRHKADAIIQAVAPALRAGALREAADEWEYGSEDRGAWWLRERANQEMAHE